MWTPCFRERKAKIRAGLKTSSVRRDKRKETLTYHIFNIEKAKRPQIWGFFVCLDKTVKIGYY